jgi:hypothetical protein
MEFINLGFNYHHLAMCQSYSFVVITVIADFS